MRKAKPKKRYLLPDPKFKDALVTRFVNNLMLKGKKNLSYSTFYDAIAIVENKVGEDGLETWKKALRFISLCLGPARLDQAANSFKKLPGLTMPLMKLPPMHEPHIT